MEPPAAAGEGTAEGGGGAAAAASAAAAAAAPSRLGRAAAAEKRRVLIVGAGLAGLTAARELRKAFCVTVIDTKEYFEFTSGIMRAYSKPGHWDSLTFMYHQVLEHRWGVRFIWGEVLSIDSSQRCARVKTMFASAEDTVPYDFCIISGGCNFNQMLPTGESPWFPTVHERERAESAMSHLDERFLEGRRRRILEEHLILQQLNDRKATVLIVGAGFMGVEWACELRHFFPGLQITLSDFLPRCLGPLPEDAAKYCEDFMQAQGIRTQYGVKFDRNNPAFWARIGLPEGADRTYILSGVKNSNYFMPKNTLSERGPGGGGWILINSKLQVMTNKAQVWGGGRVFAVGDCIAGGVGEEIPPMPKTGYPAEQQAVHACRNIRRLDRAWSSASGCGGGLPAEAPAVSLLSTWYPWGAGIFAISLGPEDGCLVVGARDEKGSGRMWCRGKAAAAQKELIESTKLGQCRGDHAFSRLLWYLVHHWPINFCGRGPLVAM